jgi:hypothetical protein
MVPLRVFDGRLRQAQQFGLISSLQGRLARLA